MERLLKVEAVAEQLGVQPGTVWKWVRQKYLASTKIGRSRRIPSSEVDRLIQAGLTVAETEDPPVGSATQRPAALPHRTSTHTTKVRPGVAR